MFAYPNVIFSWPVNMLRIFNSGHKYLTFDVIIYIAVHNFWKNLYFPKSATYKSSNNVLHSSYMEVRIDATSPFEKLAKKIKSENKKCFYLFIPLLKCYLRIL